MNDMIGPTKISSPKACQVQEYAIMILSAIFLGGLDALPKLTEFGSMKIIRCL